MTSDFDADAFAAALGPILARYLGGQGPAAVVRTVSGNINRVLELRWGGRRLGARVALHRDRFRYERDIVKEVFAVLLLSYGNGRVDDARLRRIIDGILAAPVGAHAGHAWVRPILYYDWSLQTVPHPFFIFEWIEGEPLWHCPVNAALSGLYQRAGRDLARLHQFRFAHFYDDIFAIDHQPLSWHQRFAGAYTRECAEAAPHLPVATARRLAALEVTALPAAIPCLVHNDYSGANILVEPGGGLRVIDWDNWVIECAELDLVKMKYWTILNAEGHLCHDPALFAAFCTGYTDAGGEIQPQRLAACEALWLLRVFNFERGRTPHDDPVSWQSAYPPADAYRPFLDRL